MLERCLVRLEFVRPTNVEYHVAVRQWHHLLLANHSVLGRVWHCPVRLFAEPVGLFVARAGFEAHGDQFQREVVLFNELTFIEVQFL